MGNLFEGKITWDDLKYASLSADESSKYELAEGDLLFNRTNSAELIGKSAIFTGSQPALFASYLIRFRIKPEVADAEFVCSYINSEKGRAYVHSKMTRAIGQVNISASAVQSMPIPLPTLAVQQTIAAKLREQTSAVTAIREALGAQQDSLDALGLAVIRESLSNGNTIQPIRKCLSEVIEGIGDRWRDFPVLGARRSGLAPAKEGVGKFPGRYKPVRVGTVFYNPMRILLGSIAIIDEDDAPGITSPDYVAMTAVEGVLHPLWFYHWFRSPDGAEFIKSLTRGAVRERLLFNRLANSTIPVPPYLLQVACVAKLREIKRARLHIEKRLEEVEKLPAAILHATFGEAA